MNRGAKALVEKIMKDVFETISKFRMVEKCDSILVSVSGGPDSIFLIRILLLLKNKYELKLSCFHLDHMTRDGESKKDADFVEDFCRDIKLRLFRKEIDCTKWCKENSMSFQEGARFLRINLLKQIADKQGINKIAVGHTADDNIETFFLNLFRGSGLSGLGGISPVEDNIIRPLVETRRKDILDYLEKNNIEYCIDRTNLENRYERNKVRNLLVPFIKNNFSDSFDERLLKTIEITREEDIFISAYANTGLKEIAQFNMDESGQTLQSIQIPIEKLNRYPDDLKKRIFIEAIKELKGSVEDIKSLNLEDLLVHCCSGGEKKEIALSGGLSFLKESDKLHFLFKDNSLIKDPGQWRHKINIGTKQVFKKQGIKILSRSIEGGLEKIDKEDVSESEAYMDFDKIILPVYIRNWQKDTGERFYPLGIKNSKKLHDFFIDEKIPYSKRRFLPVFTDSEKILWIGKLRLDERVKLDKNTKKILYIKIFDV
jgi:tRNA(Ile)-lysidine synthase